jgi:hypothetical protein
VSLVVQIIIVLIAAAWAGTMWRFITEGWSVRDEQRGFVWWYWPMFLLALIGIIGLVA